MRVSTLACLHPSVQLLTQARQGPLLLLVLLVLLSLNL
jgi:hypothetical protein